MEYTARMFRYSRVRSRETFSTQFPHFLYLSYSSVTRYMRSGNFNAGSPSTPNPAFMKSVLSRSSTFLSFRSRYLVISFPTFLLLPYSYYHWNFCTVRPLKASSPNTFTNLLHNSMAFERHKLDRWLKNAFHCKLTSPEANSTDFHLQVHRRLECSPASRSFRICNMVGNQIAKT